MIMTTNDPISIEEIRANLTRSGSAGYAEDDIKALLRYSGNSMLGYLTDKIGTQYRKSFTNRWEVPTSKLWHPVRLKAYGIYIPLVEAWLTSLKKERDDLKAEMQRSNTA